MMMRFSTTQVFFFIVICYDILVMFSLVLIRNQSNVKSTTGKTYKKKDDHLVSNKLRLGKLNEK